MFYKAMDAVFDRDEPIGLFAKREHAEAFAELVSEELDRDDLVVGVAGVRGCADGTIEVKKL